MVYMLGARGKGLQSVFPLPCVSYSPLPFCPLCWDIRGSFLLRCDGHGNSGQDSPSGQKAFRRKGGIVRVLDWKKKEREKPKNSYLGD